MADSGFIVNNQGIAINPTRRNSLQQHVARSTFIHYQRQRRYFVLKVYLLATIFISLTVLQWMFILKTQEYVQLFERNHFITFLGAFSALMFLSIFAFFDEVRYTVPFNLIIGLFIVECSTFGLMQALLDSEQRDLNTCFWITLGVLICFSLVGITLPRDLTMSIAWLGIASVVFYFVSCVLLFLAITVEMYLPAMILIAVMMLLLVVYIMYNAQLIVGGRTGMIRWTDYVLAALMVYFSFTVMYTMAVFVAHLLSHNNKFSQFVEGLVPAG